MAKIGGLAEVVLSVSDIDKSLAFYRDLLGLEVLSPSRLPAVFLRVGEPGAGLPQQIVLVPRSAEHSQAGGAQALHNLHHLGLQVSAEDLETERRRIEQQGIVTRSGVHPFLPVEAFYLDDPDGNEVEIVAWTG